MNVSLLISLRKHTRVFSKADPSQIENRERSVTINEKYPEHWLE
ncbi:hypothetical protein QVL63_02425 [Bartonella henselae]|nr:hypothetical protein [Bartonella henselae]MDM9984660.1 hypothetical protein [Bartonella henselae]MDM9995021.1 hypothetical protein [Bartonella henselae]